MYEQQQDQVTQRKYNQDNKTILTIVFLVGLFAGFLFYFSIQKEGNKNKTSQDFIIQQVMMNSISQANKEVLEEKKLQFEKMQSYTETFVYFQDWMDKQIWDQKKQQKKILKNSQTQTQMVNLHIKDLRPQSPQLPSGQNQKLQRKQNIINSPRQRLTTGISEHKIQQWKQFIRFKDTDELGQLSEIQRQYYEQEYKISSYPELPFCIIVPTYQNMENNRSISNIKSILQQNYSNYKVFIIDDSSPDGTGQKLKSYLSSINVSQEKVKVLINQKREMAMSNIYRAAYQLCQKYQLFVLVDGDDQIVGRHVLKLFNAVFQMNDVWIAYSNFLTSHGEIGYSRPYSKQTIRNNKYRLSVFTISHLRVFYTKLFTLIKEKDLKNDEGQWFHASNDVAMYIPMMQMSHNRIKYVPEITYLYNLNTGMNNHKIRIQEQKNNENTVKRRQQYSEISSLFTTQEILELKKTTKHISNYS